MRAPQTACEEQDGEVRISGDVRRRRSGAKNKFNLIAYLQDRICFYANSNDTPSEQIKGMNRLLRDIIRLEVEIFGDKE